MKTIESLKPGEFFKRKSDSKKVYQRGSFCRSSKKYAGEDWDDISREIYIKKGTKVFTEFEF